MHFLSRHFITSEEKINGKAISEREERDNVARAFGQCRLVENTIDIPTDIRLFGTVFSQKKLGGKKKRRRGTDSPLTPWITTSPGKKETRMLGGELGRVSRSPID